MGNSIAKPTGGGGGGTWGSITGTLSDQADLQSALDLKLNISDFNLSTFDTGDLADSLNKRYVTDADLVKLGNLSGTNTGDQNSIVGITGTKAQFDTALTDGNFLYVGDVTQYTDENAQDAVGGILTDTSSIDFTYDDAGNQITADIKALGVTNAMLAGSIAASKLVGTDIATVGTLTAGATGAGFTIALGTSTLTGDLPFANLTQVAGFSILAKATTGTGDVAALTAGTDSVLMRSGSGDLTFGTIVTNQITNDAVTYAKIQNVSATSRILGRITAGAGDIEELTAVNVATIINSSLDHGTLTGLGDDDHTQYLLRQPAADWVINDSGGDFDGRFEGDTDQNLLYLNAGLDSVGVGCSDPAQKFEVRATTSAMRGMAVSYYQDDVQAGNINIRKARGTPASPTSLNSGDTVGGFGMQGYGATAGTGGFKNAGFIRVLADEAFSNTAAGATMRFDTTPIGSTTVTPRFYLTANGNVILGNQVALATNATDGFAYIPTQAGAPTGVPTAYTGKVAMTYDTTNNKLYIYNGAWKSVTLA